MYTTVVTAGSVEVDCTLIWEATFCSRAARAKARASYERALALTQQEPERRFLDRRLAEVRDLTPAYDDDGQVVALPLHK